MDRSWERIPRALRILQLPDRIVLHDASYALRCKTPTDRNVLVDAVNHVHSRSSSSDPAIIVDLSPAPAVSGRSKDESNPNIVTEKDRYLVLPFPSPDKREVKAYEASSPASAGILNKNILSVEAAAGFLGFIRLHSGFYCILASNMRQVGELPQGPILSVVRVKLFKLGGGPMTKEDREFAAPIIKLLESGSVYYAAHCDLTLHSAKACSASRRTGKAFWWTWPLVASAGPVAYTWGLRTIYGFVGSRLMRFSADGVGAGSGEFQYTLVSRRSRRRAGTRYITRGADADGNVANFVETEQVVWCRDRPAAFASFLIIRGSVPVFWRQNNGIARPSPELDSDLTTSRHAFSSHFRHITRSYGQIGIVSLVDKMGSEGVLAAAFEQHYELDLQGFEAERAVKLIAFDFHRHCAGKEYERGLAALLSRVRDDVGRHEFFTHGLESFRIRKIQKGVFRVNCVDCLDRTNVVQSIIARVALSQQLHAIFRPEMSGEVECTFRLYADSEDRFKQVWGDNADRVSKQYSGTGALKTDFTRTGKRSTTGVIGDGMKSVMRMYYKNFVDEGRQESIDILCGNAVIDPIKFASSQPAEGVSALSSLNTFQAQRMNAGGVRQEVSIRLSDSELYVSTPEGVGVDYPRGSLTSWERIQDGKPGDRKTGLRLRLWFAADTQSSAAASPLDLLFRDGIMVREKFLRTLLLWASPPVVLQIDGSPIRLRCLAGMNVGDHKMASWELHESRPSREVVALIVPDTYASGRPWGLGAVPVDVDACGYVLVSAVCVPNGGPAIAVLASKDVAPTVMSVSEATVDRPTGPPSAMQGSGVAVSMMVSGTSVCFASLNVKGPEELFRVVSALKLRNSVFDITNQFHHVCIAGKMADLKWQKTPATGPSSRQWVNLNDGSACYSLRNGLAVLRNSFPRIRWDNMLNPESLWSFPEDTVNPDASQIIALMDGVTNGRPAPTVWKSALQYVATLSNLCGKDIRPPPGTDSNIPLSTYLSVFSEYSSGESVGTKPTARPTDNPVWGEQVRLVLHGADTDEIMSSFIMGQMMISTPLSDTVVAGHFVIPMSRAGELSGEFTVPIRLAGIFTGRLQGFLKLTSLKEGSEGATVALRGGGSKFAQGVPALEWESIGL